MKCNKCDKESRRCTIQFLGAIYFSKMKLQKIESDVANKTDLNVVVWGDFVQISLELTMLTGLSRIQFDLQSNKHSTNGSKKDFVVPRIFTEASLHLSGQRCT